MMAEYEIRDSEPITVASVSKEGPYAQMPQAFVTLYRWIEDNDHRPEGMPRGVYLTDPAETPESEARWEAWVPIEEDAEPYGPDAEGIAVKRIPAMRVVSTMYRGPYDTLAQAYEPLTSWVRGQGLSVTGPPMEAYYNGPEDTNPEEYVTEILFPVSVA